MAKHNKSGMDETSSIQTSDDDTSKGSSKGSNHHLGAAVIHKLSSPISDTLRKVVVRKDSDGMRTPISSRKVVVQSEHDTASSEKSHHHPMKDVADFFGEGGKAVKRLVHHRGKSQDSVSSRSIPEDTSDDDTAATTAVPPDATLEKMNVIINRRLKDTSISNYHAAAWLENVVDGQEPLYRSFLEESGKENIIVGEWEQAEPGCEFVGDWDGEKYTQKRTVTFVFDKKVPMQSKPVVAQVTQTHYCRIEGNDKCVVAMTIEMQNVPFSDCFNVEVRWVSSRSGKDCVVQVGLFVNFIKGTMLAGKIRAGTTQQTTQQQMQLFEKVQAACGASVEEVSDEDEEEQPPKSTTLMLSSDEAGRVLVLSGCLLLLASQAESIFSREFHAAAQMQMTACSVTSILAGFMFLVPTVCQSSEYERLLVVVAHLVQGLCVSLASKGSVATTLSTTLLMAAWAVLAYGVWRQGTSNFKALKEE